MGRVQDTRPFQAVSQQDQQKRWRKGSENGGEERQSVLCQHFRRAVYFCQSFSGAAMRFLPLERRCN